MPASGARCAAGHPVALRSRLRADWHSRNQPRLVPVTADVGARTENPRAGAQSRLTVVCRCGLARAVHAPRPRRTERPHRARTTEAAVAADQPVLLSRSSTRQANAARLREV